MRRNGSTNAATPPPNRTASREQNVSELPILTRDGCGACCLHSGVPPFRDHEWHNVPIELVADIRRFRGDMNGPCLWFDPETRRCRHYEFRPIGCREFEAGKMLCRMTRDVAADFGFPVLEPHDDQRPSVPVLE